VGDTLVMILMGLGVLAGGVWIALQFTEPQRLRRAWFRNTPLPRSQAQEALARHLMALKERFPNRSEAWYLRKILSDLQRDRR
jgi:hypothetical protein